MKELLKVISKKLLLWSIVFNTIYSITDYGEACNKHYSFDNHMMKEIIKV